MIRRKKNSSIDYQSLEARQVLSADPIVSFTGGQISIQGTEHNDTAYLTQNEDVVRVSVRSDNNSYTHYEFSNSEVEKIYFSGKAGDDLFINKTEVASTAYGNDGNDWLNGGSANDVFRGGNGDDQLRGYDGDDSLHGDYGNDRLYGFDGNDRLLGWYGHDVLSGGDGDDYVSGYLGNDTLFGGAGDDVLKGHEGHDLLGGGDGNDQLYGWLGNDKLFGGEGDDYLSGYHGHDTISGQGGDDVIKGHEGNDRLFGGDGDDAIYGWLGHDLVNGGAGNDEIWGGDDNDTLVGGTGNDILHGDQGNDLLIGNDGDDVLIGFYGNDRMIGGLGSDMFCGGYGRDGYVDFGSEDFGYDPDQDIFATGGDDGTAITEETWNLLQQSLNELQEVADKVAASVNFTVADNIEPTFANATASSNLLFVNDSQKNLSSYNTDTGEYELIGNLGVTLADIALSADGNLYGVSFSTLYRIDVTNADVAEVGNFGRADINALTFTADGTLLAAGFAGDQLYSVDVTSGQLTSLGFSWSSFRWRLEHP